MNLVKNGLYRHYKGGIYKLVDFAKHTETEETLVIYKSLNDDDLGTVYARPKEMFIEKIDGQYRFTFVGGMEYLVGKLVRLRSKDEYYRVFAVEPELGQVVIYRTNDDFEVDGNLLLVDYRKVEEIVEV